MLQKNCKKIIFKFFFSKGGPFDVGMVEKYFFDFSKFQNVFEKWPQWDITSVERNKVMKNEISLGILQRAIQGNLLVGAQSAPPRVI